MLKCNVSWFRFPRILNFTRKRHETMWYEGNVCFSCRFVETRKTLYLRLYFVSLFFAVDVSKLWSSTWKVCAKNKLDVLPVKDIEEYFQNRVLSEKSWLRLNGRLSSFPYRDGMMFRYITILYAKHKLISRMFQLYHGNKKRQWRVMSVCSNCTMSPQKLSRAVQNSISFGWQRWLDHFMNIPYQSGVRNYNH